jgi:hypothetical protein
MLKDLVGFLTAVLGVSSCSESWMSGCGAMSSGSKRGLSSRLGGNGVPERILNASRCASSEALWLCKALRINGFRARIS